MNPLRIMLATAILSLSVSGAVYIVKNQNLTAQKPDKENSAVALPIKTNNLVLSQPFIEQLAPKNLSHSSLSQETDNLTSELSKGLAKAFALTNPDGPTTINNQKAINLPNLEEVLNNLSAKTLGKLDLVPKTGINNADLNISDLNTESALNEYINNIQKIIRDSDESAANLNRQYFAAVENLYQKNGPETSNDLINDVQNINNLMSNELLKNMMILSRDRLSKIMAVQKEALGQLYQITIPSSVTEFHKNLLFHLSAKQKILAADQNSATDPLIALERQQALEKINFELADLLQNQLPNLKNNL